MLRNFFILFFLACSVCAWADESTVFNTFSVSAGQDRGEAVGIDGKGRVVVGVTANATARSVLAFKRFNKTGETDFSFGKKGVVKLNLPARIYGLIVHHDGSFIAAGTMGKRGARDLLILYFASDGQLQNQWVFNLGGEDEIHYLAQSQEGRLYFSGFSQQPAGAKAFVGAMNIKGNIDKSFGDEGFVFLNRSANDRFFGLTIDDHGRLLASGSFLNPQGDIDMMVARFTVIGKPDGFFTTHLGDGPDYAAAVMTLKDEVVVTGYTSVTHGLRLFFVKWHEQGQLLEAPFLFDAGSNGHALSVVDNHWVAAGEKEGAPLLIKFGTTQKYQAWEGKKENIYIHAMSCENQDCYLVGNKDDKALLTKISLSFTF
ncbi:hypothetical protein K1X76_03110 [bacterium]|nr:hypothetical protein [bacterium]